MTGIKDYVNWSVSTAAGLLDFRDEYIFIEDVRSVQNKTWVVTGATGGIGFQLAKFLVFLDARVWLVGRDANKMGNALAVLRQIHPLAKVDAVLVDYNDLSTVKPGLQKILENTTQIDGIIHNAGVMNVPSGTVTKQNYEQHVGVNNLAAQLVQDLLDPLIVNNPNGRIVWVSSMAHMLTPLGGIDFTLTAEKCKSTWPVYAQSKAVNYVQTVQWTRKHRDSKVKSVAVHPGVINSDIARHTRGLSAVFLRLIQYELPDGIRAPIVAALSSSIKNNDYIVPWGRPGYIRPDIKALASSNAGESVDKWIEEQIERFK